MYELITQKEADRIKYILENTGLLRPINIEVPDSKYKIKAVNITESYDSEQRNYHMNEFHLIDENDGYDVLEYKNKLYEVFVSFGEWAYETRLKNTHIAVGTSKFNDYSFQLELSQAIMDEKNLYIAKNISNFAGEGALVRVYRGLGKDKAKKENRREKFIEKFNSEIIKYAGKEWVVISKIALEDLFDDNKSEEIFYNLINSILHGMLLVEGIGKEEE